ncbi:hypothetical protein AAY473_006044 [Plecturocebus cupreus]
MKADWPVQWLTPVIPALWDTEAGESLEKNTCLAAETTKCASPEAGRSVEAIDDALCLCGRKKFSSDSVCYTLSVVGELPSQSWGKKLTTKRSLPEQPPLAGEVAEEVLTNKETEQGPHIIPMDKAIPSYGGGHESLCFRATYQSPQLQGSFGEITFLLQNLHAISPIRLSRRRCRALRGCWSHDSHTLSYHPLIANALSLSRIALHRGPLFNPSSPQTPDGTDSNTSRIGNRDSERRKESTLQHLLLAASCLGQGRLIDSNLAPASPVSLWLVCCKELETTTVPLKERGMGEERTKTPMSMDNCIQFTEDTPSNQNHPGLPLQFPDRVLAPASTRTASSVLSPPSGRQLG